MHRAADVAAGFGAMLGDDGKGWGAGPTSSRRLEGHGGRLPAGGAGLAGEGEKVGLHPDTHWAFPQGCRWVTNDGRTVAMTRMGLAGCSRARGKATGGVFASDQLQIAEAGARQFLAQPLQILFRGARLHHNANRAAQQRREHERR